MFFYGELQFPASVYGENRESGFAWLLSEATDGGYLSLRDVFIDGIQAVSCFFVFNFEYARNPAAA
mgnify:CR=1 FL=1